MTRDDEMPERRPYYAPDADGDGRVRGLLLWLLAPLPLVGVVAAAMIFVDSFLIVAAVVVGVTLLAALVWHELGQW